LAATGSFVQSNNRTFGVNGFPRVSGTMRVGQTVEVIGRAAAFSPEPTRFTHQWMRGETPIAGATGRTYTLRQADLGQQISVRVTAHRAGFTPRTRRTPLRTVQAARAGAGSGTASASPSPSPTPTAAGNLSTNLVGLWGMGPPTFPRGSGDGWWFEFNADGTGAERGEDSIRCPFDWTVSGSTVTLTARPGRIPVAWRDWDIPACRGFANRTFANGVQKQITITRVNANRIRVTGNNPFHPSQSENMDRL
jgi:hypothetical protein